MILMVYNKQICKEFLLPNIHDADHTIYLHHDIYRLKKDLEIRLENSSKGWEIVCSEEYYVKLNQVRKERHILKHQDIIEVKTQTGERFHLLVADCMLTFQIMEKYDISMMKEVSIGKGGANLIQYRFMELISSAHAVMEHTSEGWFLTDISSNGVFCQNVWVQRKRKLEFGDHIDIFGLHILFLGQILAVGTYYGQLTVKDDILKPLHMEPVEVGALTGKEKKKEVYFHRSPRNLPTIYQEEAEIEAPPNPKQTKQKPVYLTIGPAFTMAIPMMLGCGFAIFGSRLSGRASGAFMYTGLITAITSALIGVIWAVLNLNYSKKENAEEENQRFNAYSNYLIQIADTLRTKYQHNAAALKQIYPSASQCLTYNQNSSELWNRNNTHSDFLHQRLGLGEQPFQVNIQIPKDKFTLINDSLQEKPKMIQAEFQTLYQVPVCISLLDKRLIGLVGGDGKQGAVEMMHTLVAGITAGHCYTDVKLVFIYRERDRRRREDWECMKWFPHVWSEDKRTRYMASNELETGDIFFEISNVIRGRSQKDEISINRDRRRVVKPHYILFISDPSVLEGEILAKYIYSAKPEYGITTFLMVEHLEELPNACEDVIENNASFRGFYNLLDTDHEKKTFTPDRVGADQLSAFGIMLSDIRVNEIESNSEIPGSLDFFSMYGVSSLEEFKVLERWRKNRNYNSMKALIGKKAGDADCYLDIHEKFHGPHGLIAGTTGSGKSETLQTWILSLAINFSPEDVSFFIIDFKGGGMANLFSDLPHLTGQISNLSGNQVRRAMISIKSENRRRQQIFSEYGVNNINLYTQLYKNQESEIPIPHLLIIIDEFAELKREEPEFMRELISVAQVGRSLGVHLILATQKPGGTVDDSIWSNSKFRLCLRVQDRQDSNDMLHKPDAAFITQAGRCYMQVGNDEIYELFQSGYSGAVYEEDYSRKSVVAEMLTRTGKAELIKGHHKRAEKKKGGHVKEKTQLDAVIEYLGKIAKENHYKKTMQLWLPILKSEIYLSELNGYGETCYENQTWKPMPHKWKLEALIGLCDDPEGQAQKPLSICFSENGHHAVCGSVVSGKSTFLQSLVYSLISRYSPEVLWLYLLDFSSHLLAPFESAPHVGSLIFDNQEEKLARFIHMLTKMMDERKKLLAGGNYSQYVQAYGIKMPAMLIIVDNFASFREKTQNKYDDVMLRLAREGVGYGIYLVVSAAGFGLSEIPSRLGDNIRTVVSLEQADKFKYQDVLRMTRLSILPETDVRGRGLAVVDGRVLEFQTALSLPAEDDFERGQLLESYCRKMRAVWNGKCAVVVPEIPEHPTLELFTDEESYKKADQDKGLLPLGYHMEDASVYSLNLMHNYCCIISGKGRVGKTNTLKILLHAAYRKTGKVCVIEKGTAELRKLSEEYGAEYISEDSQLFTYLSGLLPVFSARNKKKRAFMESGLDEAAVFDEMSKEEPIFIFLADLAEFFRMVYKPEEKVGNTAGFVENILEKGSLHNIYFIGCLKVEDHALLSMYKAYKSYISYKKGIHLGGNLQAQTIFSFQNLSYTQQTKSSKKGIGYVPDEEEESNGIEVVIPLAKM